MRKILAGLDTEFGLWIEGRDAFTQIEDATAFVRSYPNEGFFGWDYTHESSRSDLRGFKLKNLAYDPEDAKFDSGKNYGPAHEVRSDHILKNGARFYNDHGHPEYATPESFSIFGTAAYDAAGQLELQQTAEKFEKELGKKVRVYKNNTDFHGSSYGTHESYLVPRQLGFEKLFQAVTPVLLARQVLTGAGKVGYELGAAATYQLSQRADFFVEAANAETLYRRPVFNTRDEAHADPSAWMRMHVISGDSNMLWQGTALKMGLIKLALWLLDIDQAPKWALADPVRDFEKISKDESFKFEVKLKNRSWTTAFEILESYCSAAEKFLEQTEEVVWTLARVRNLTNALQIGNVAEYQTGIDWAAKKNVLDQLIEAEGTDWRDNSLKAYDLEYHNLNPEEGLFFALAEMGAVEAGLEESIVADHRFGIPEPSRARARGLAVSKFKEQLRTACWRTITMKGEKEDETFDLAPDRIFGGQFETISNVEEFKMLLRGTN